MFSKKTIKFLRELKKNNNREWFEKNKDRYEGEVRSPALAYIEAMGQPLSRISPHFIAAAKKSGGSMMRPYRDIRFSSDKTPYKTNIGIQFRHEAGKDVHAPGFYLHIEPGEFFLAAGMWHPDTPTLNKVRTLIDEYPSEWQAIKRKILRQSKSETHPFEMHGDSLKKAPKGFPVDHPQIEDLKRKHYIMVMQLTESTITEKNVVKNTTALFKKASPLVKFICEANDLDY